MYYIYPRLSEIIDDYSIQVGQTTGQYTCMLLYIILGKEVLRVGHGLEFQGVATGIFEEHRPLLARLPWSHSAGKTMHLPFAYHAGETGCVLVSVLENDRRMESVPLKRKCGSKMKLMPAFCTRSASS